MGLTRGFISVKINQMAGLTSQKARKILEDKSVRGHKLTPAQRRFFGAKASGSKAK